jgi:hypothetical protein
MADDQSDANAPSANSEGRSRRPLIKASAVAGEAIWTGPVVVDPK